MPFNPPAPDRPPRRFRRLARLVAGLLVVAATWACGPVYLPVPPPMQTTFTAELITDAGGNQRQVWIAMGGPNDHAQNAVFYLFDQERNAGVIAGAMADGSYVAPPMEGTEGDHILIHYRDVQGRNSASACLLLSEKPQPDTCP